MFISVVRPRKKRGEGVCSIARGGGDETRRTQHAPVVDTAEPNGTERDAGTEGGAETPTDRTKRLTHSLTPRLGYGNDATATAFLKNDNEGTNPEERGDARRGEVADLS